MLFKLERMITTRVFFGIILFVGTTIILIMSLGVRYSLQSSYDQEGATAFEKAYTILDDKVKTYVYGLQGIGGVFVVTNRNPTSGQVREYAHFRNFFSNFDGLLGFGFIRRVALNELPSFEREMRKEKPEFKVKSISSEIPPVNMIIQYIEPIEANAQALGLNIATEDSRRNAALLAMDTGEPALTKPIKLVQVFRPTENGFLYLLPVYSVAYVPASVEERRRLLVGWAYAPVVTSALEKYVRSRTNDSLKLKVTDMDSGESIFDYSRGGRSIRSKVLVIGGQNWKIEGFYHNPGRKNLITVIPAVFFFFFLSLFSLMSVSIRKLLMANSAKRSS